MQFRSVLSIGRSQPSSAIEEALDRHARLTIGGDLAGAAIVRQQQDAETADLMLLAEQLACALEPLSLSEATYSWIWQLVLAGEPLSRRRRLASAVRGHGREAVLGVALVGTAVSIGAVALRFRGRRQPDGLVSNPS